MYLYHTILFLLYIRVCSLAASFIKPKDFPESLQHNQINKLQLTLNLPSNPDFLYKLHICRSTHLHIHLNAPQLPQTQKIQNRMFLISNQWNQVNSSASWFLLLSSRRWQDLSDSTSFCQSEGLRHSSIKWLLIHHLESNSP